MALYFAVHTYKKNPAEFGVFLAARAAHIVKTMAAGKTPAKCVKTWDPSGQGAEPCPGVIAPRRWWPDRAARGGE